MPSCHCCLRGLCPSCHHLCHLCCPSQPPNDLNLNLNLLIYSFSCSFEDGDDDMIEVIVKKNFNIEGGMKGDALTLDVMPDYSILQIKTLVRSLWPIPVKHQRLKLNEK